MRKLCFGGSFNPIHHGHLICAQIVAEQLGFDRVVLIPSGQPPHKSAFTDMAAASDRLAMCQAGVSGNPLFEVNPIEIERGGPSYTLNSARQLRQQGWQEIVWLIGADMALSLPTWHQPDALLTEVRFLIMARPGSILNWEALPPKYQSLARDVVEVPQIDISSSEIRRRVVAGLSIDYLTPADVVNFIRDHGLYAEQKTTTQ